MKSQVDNLGAFIKETDDVIAVMLLKIKEYARLQQQLNKVDFSNFSCLENVDIVDHDPKNNTVTFEVSDLHAHQEEILNMLISSKNICENLLFDIRSLVFILGKSLKMIKGSKSFIKCNLDKENSNVNIHTR